MAKRNPLVKQRHTRVAAALSTQNLRTLVQLGFLALIGYLFYMHAITPETGASGSASPEALCPMGGLETAYKFVITGGSYVPHTHASNIILFVAVVLSALLAKGFFCGWVCSFGAIQEGITAGSKWLQKRVSGYNTFVAAVRAGFAFLQPVEHWLRYGKYLVLAWALIGSAVYGVMVFRDVDPWAALLTITEFQLTLGFGVLVLTVVASLFVERPFCKYGCPLGAVVGLLGFLSLTKVQREAATCSGCNVCSKHCPMGIPVHSMSRVSAPECNMCLQCVDICPRVDALAVKMALPGVPAAKEA